ncbi:MAG: T9SS type A sorting domain-containing protein [Saprospiraceae bacterium]|nr:T9SS type A sorting domain-containing protein [Saprospiraceae bacterium]
MSKLEFLDNNIEITYIDEDVPFRGVNVSIADSFGHLQCFSNGKHLFNKNYETMDRLWDWEASPCDTLGSVALKEVQGGTAGFSVYPNPTSDIVNIRLEQAANADCHIELLSMTGQLIGSQNMPEGTVTATLPLEDFPNGYYFLRVIDAGRKISGQKIAIIR